jgi:DNA end-binding protein Ku
MAAPRPYWKGQVQISLVQFGVGLYSATESKSGITFNQLSRKTGERIRMQKTAGDTALESDDIVKGYEYSKGKYVIVEPSELQNLRLPSKHTIAVTQFIDLNELCPSYIEKPYFVLPENDTQLEAYAIVRQALLNTGKAAVGTFTTSGRENIVAIVAADKGMMAFVLRFENELRKADNYFANLNLPVANEDAVDMATALISKRAAAFDHSKFVDGYEVAVRQLVEAKLANQPIPQDEPAQASNVVSILDALRKSVGESEGEKKAPASEATPKKTRPRKTA